MEEIWRPVPYQPFDKAYSVSNLGRVRPNVVSRYSKNKADVLKPSPGTRGYLHVSLYYDGKAKSCFIHRMVALVFLGESPSPELQVCHKDDNKTNNHADNLEWGTAKQNAFTRDTIGKATRGTANGMARLDETKVRAIREAYATGLYTQAEVGAMFGVKGGAVQCILVRRTWRHVI